MSNPKVKNSFTNFLKAGTAQISSVIEIFMIAKQAQMISARTLDLYENEVSNLKKFMGSIGITLISEMDEIAINKYIVHRAQTCKPRTVHITYRV